MRLLRRNTTLFDYMAYQGEEEVLEGELHTGNYMPVYADAVQYRGNISAPSGFVTDNLFGTNTNYTHVLLLDKPDADIQECGIIECNGATYEIKAVRPSLNVLAVALKKRTKNNAPEVQANSDDPDETQTDSNDGPDETLEPEGEEP